MAGDPTILFCVGATKAGTTWFYRYLHDHPECHMRSIKELHYFDTVDFGDYARQADVYARLRADLEAKRAEASGWTEKNLARQIADIDEIEAVIAKGDAGEADYVAYLMRGLGQAKTGEDHRLVGDITPSYALLSQDRLARMAALSPRARFVFLMRDPVDRLWSHVRMQATRQRQPGEQVPVKAKRILNRVVNRGLETHIPERGDYVGAIARLTAAVPADRLLVTFAEQMRTEAGLRGLCDFLGISYRAPDDGLPLHKGPALPMSPRQRDEAARYLAPQYDFVDQAFGPLPDAWAANRAGV